MPSAGHRKGLPSFDGVSGERRSLGAFVIKKSSDSKLLCVVMKSLRHKMQTINTARAMQEKKRPGGGGGGYRP